MIPEGKSVRKPRRDGLQNRAAVLDTARRLFAERGSATSLDEIAREAGVGNGTLYRHFPTRGALVDAVCHGDAQNLIEGAVQLARDLPPAEALGRWLDAFIDHIGERNIVVESVGALVAPDADRDGSSGEKVRDAFLGLFEGAVAAGGIRTDLDPLDILRALAGLAVVGAPQDWARSAKALNRVLLAGLRASSADGTGYSPPSPGSPAR